MIQVQGIDILVEGPSDAQAPTLLMVHGWPDTHRLWDAQAAYLQTQWRCVRFTLPGCAVQGFATGHWVMVQQPQAFNQCVGDWLKA